MDNQKRVCVSLKMRYHSTQIVAKFKANNQLIFNDNRTARTVNRTVNMQKNNHLDKLPLLITTGEPAGIGMDIVLDALLNTSVAHLPLVVTADSEALINRLAILAKNDSRFDKPFSPTVIPLDCLPLEDFTACAIAKLKDRPYSMNAPVILHIPCPTPPVCGVINTDNAKQVYQQLTAAHLLACHNVVSGIVTAPIAKSVMIEGGIDLDNGEAFSGHTEFFMHKCGLDKVVMMLANSVMKVALVTTHLPLRDVPDAITTQAVAQTVQITHDELVNKFGIKRPKILVCGLNPHAGESGHLGVEESQIINPVLQMFQDKGMDISLALPADTLFTPKHLAACDVVIAMYHDQGLAPLKSHGFGDTVNITLALPYIRTSVDHGTAFDLAGTGRACAKSLQLAIQMARQMAQRRQ